MNYKELEAALSGLGEFNRKSNEDLMATARAAYDPQYANDLQNLRDSLTQQLAQQQRSAVSNGMQRSSYNQAAQAALGTGGLRSQADLAGTYEGNVGALYAQLLQNEDNREDTYNANRDNLLLQLYNLNHKSSGGGGGSGGNGGTTPSTTPSTTPTSDLNGLKDSLNKPLTGVSLDLGTVTGKTTPVGTSAVSSSSIANGTTTLKSSDKTISDLSALGFSNDSISNLKTTAANVTKATNAKAFAAGNTVADVKATSNSILKSSTPSSSLSTTLQKKNTAKNTLS